MDYPVFLKDKYEPIYVCLLADNEHIVIDNIDGKRVEYSKELTGASIYKTAMDTDQMIKTHKMLFMSQLEGVNNYFENKVKSVW